MDKRMTSFNQERALNYDEESIFGRGDRTKQVDILEDILSYKERVPKQLIELGCGTGFFTRVLLNRYPDVHAVLFDASSAMIDVARTKFIEYPNVVFSEKFLEEIQWKNIPKADIIFSSLTIHHLEDDAKNKLYNHIYENLQDGGRFIYFDQFRSADESENELLEYLSCKDIQRRLISYVGNDFAVPEFEMDNIIQKDRDVKRSENDKEQEIGQAVLALKRARFKSVSTVYQEGRLYAIVGFK